jgi:hypothetical protein
MKIVQQLHRRRASLLVNRCGHWVQVEHRDMFNRAMPRLPARMADTGMDAALIQTR